MTRPITYMVLSVLLVAWACVGCGVHDQRAAIRDARYGLLAAGEAVKVVDGVVADGWCQADPHDTESYCKCKRTALVLEQAVLALEDGALAVRTWELALMRYEGHKDDKGWASVLNSAGDWLTIASQIVGIADGIKSTLELYGIKLPAAAAAVWSFIAAMSPYGPHAPHEFDWTSLKGTVCEVKP